jgi:Neuraminidase (sialidase)
MTTNTSDSQPQVMLEISNDGGKTWGNPLLASMGAVGEYKARARWQRLGYSRDRVFRVTVTAGVKVAMLSAFIGVEPGTS